MSSTIVFTFVGQDKPGLVERLASTVSRHGGNWLESRMSQLAGNFAGIARVQISDQQQSPLTEALAALQAEGLTVSFQGDNSASLATHSGNDYSTATINLIGNDRPGIVSELSHALAVLGVNVCEMNTEVSSAPMTAEALFQANAELQIPTSLLQDELLEKLEEIANRLAVDINLED